MEEQGDLNASLIAMSKATEHIAGAMTNFARVLEDGHVNATDALAFKTALLTMSKSNEETAGVMSAFKQIYAQSEQRREKIEKQKRLDGYLIPLITVLGVAMTLFAQSSWDYHREQVQYMYQQIKEIQTKTDHMAAKKDAINGAMDTVRSIREASSQLCINGKYSGDPYKLNESIMTAQYKLIDAWYALADVFDEVIQKKAKMFLDLSDANVNNNTNICSNEAKTLMNKLKNNQIEANQLMRQALKVEMQRKSAIETNLSK
jgi:hypothetical protein